MSHFLSSNFVYVIIITIKKKGKKQTIVKTDPGITKNDHGIQDGVNGTKALSADRKALALVDEKALAD